MRFRSNDARPSRTAVAILLAVHVGLLAGCNDDDGNTTAGVRLYFATSNIQECMPMEVRVGLAAAGAIVATNGDGSPDCEVDTTLAGLGCTGTFELLDDVATDDTLLATIDGCEVPSEANLFDCEFSQGDADAITDSVESFCDCVGEPECHLNIYCLQRPEICVNEDAGPSACEECFNEIDDDGDGFVDCEDANCYVVDCGVGQTTITCSTSTTSITLATTLSGE